MEPNIITIKTLAELGEISLPIGVSNDNLATCYAALKQLTNQSIIDMDAVRADLFSSDVERVRQRLLSLLQLFRACYVQKLVIAATYMLKYIEHHGASNSTTLADQFIADMLAFSICIHTAEHRAQTNTVASPEYASETQRQNLLNQLQQTLGAFDDESSLRILAQLEKNKPNDRPEMLLTMRNLVKAFAFEKAIGVLAKFRCASPRQLAGGRKPVILAVDDIPHNLATLKNILGDQYKFVGVTSGQAVLQYIETNIPDAYILDIKMPGMNGFEVAEQIRRRRKLAPIIFLTANSTVEHVVKAFEMGITDFLVKPCSRQAVLAKLEVLTLK